MVNCVCVCAEKTEYSQYGGNVCMCKSIHNIICLCRYKIEEYAVHACQHTHTHTTHRERESVSSTETTGCSRTQVLSLHPALGREKPGHGLRPPSLQVVGDSSGQLDKHGHVQLVLVIAQ